MPLSATPASYRGRFAPSPTGPLHMGSLIAAVASYLDARAAQGVWLVRMEDLDPPREEAGAAERILHSLEQHGLHWDESVLYQSARGAAYDAALQQLAETGALFPCSCTRAQMGPNGHCVGTCRSTTSDALDSGDCALRVAIPTDCDIQIEDGLQGAQCWPLGKTVKDFAVKRRDGLFAYQLAVVVDDTAQRITHIVRGHDLLDSTPRQIFLQRQLHLPQPFYAHLPVITNRTGQKLSKQNRAPALDGACAADNLRIALRFLNQPEPPRELRAASDLLGWAAEHWALPAVPARPSLPAAAFGLED